MSNEPTNRLSGIELLRLWIADRDTGECQCGCGLTSCALRDGICQQINGPCHCYPKKPVIVSTPATALAIVPTKSYWVLILEYVRTLV